MRPATGRQRTPCLARVSGCLHAVSSPRNRAKTRAFASASGQSADEPPSGDASTDGAAEATDDRAERTHPKGTPSAPGDEGGGALPSEHPSDATAARPTTGIEPPPPPPAGPAPVLFAIALSGATALWTGWTALLFVAPTAAMQIAFEPLNTDLAGHASGVYLVAGLGAAVALVIRAVRRAASTPGRLATTPFRILAASLVLCAAAGLWVLYRAGGRALLDTFPASTFLVTAAAGCVALQSRELPTTGGAYPAPDAPPAAEAPTPIDRALANVPDAAAARANWAVVAMAVVTAAAALTTRHLPPPARLVGVVSIPAAAAAATLALGTGKTDRASGLALPIDTRRSLHQAVVAYSVAMVSLVRGYPFGLVNLTDVARTAGPMVAEPLPVAALGAWLVAVAIGVVGLMKTPGEIKRRRRAPPRPPTASPPAAG